MIRITQLPSGYWVVWQDADWIDASSITREQAEQKALELTRQTA